MKSTFYPIKYVDALFPVYNINKGGLQKTPSVLSTEELLKFSNEKAIDLGMGDTGYPNFLPFTMDEFERHLYMYYINGLNPYPGIGTKFKCRSADPV